ncbi:MAG TPA: [LysW]-aminoadipate kinase, partial [Chloroflexi bacterium]|nr:[LysW]-aminoadipate kinase [Chloroflexota bacterium]
MLVVKVGGGAGNELDGALRDLAALWTAGERW